MRRFTTQEVASQLGFSVTHVLRLLKGSGGCRKRLDGVQNDRGDWLVDEDSVTRFKLSRGPWRERSLRYPDHVRIQEACERLGQDRNELLGEIYRSGNVDLIEWDGDIPMIREFYIKAWEQTKKG